MHKHSAQTLIRMARMDCEAVAEGRPFTPVVFQSGECPALLP